MDINIPIFSFPNLQTGIDLNSLLPTRISNDPTIVTRFMRRNEVIFVGTSLCPDKVPNYYFDNTNVNAFCQKSNRLALNDANNAAIFQQNEGIVGSSSNAFARVLSTSNNIVYLNMNFVTMNITAYGANTLSSGNYAVDDVVFQTDGNGTTCFQGKVEYYDSANGVISVSPTSGTLNAAGNFANSVIRKLNGTVLSNAMSIIRGNLFPSGSSIRSTSNSSNTGTVVSFDFSSGVFTSANGSNTLTVMAHANSSYQVGNTLTIVSGSGQGEIRTVSAVTNNVELVLNSAITGLTSNSKYTIGPHVIDEFGKITGIYHIPEGNSLNFPVGERVFTITDTGTSSNNDYLMRASASYKVTGAPEIVMPPIRIDAPTVPTVPVRRRRRRWFDPLAQTFFTPEANELESGIPKAMYGVFISSVDLFFAEKPILADLQLPVTVQIVEVENGLPTDKIIATSTVECRDVKVSVVPDASNPDTVTNFKFADPVYLNSSTEYAIVVVSDSPDYNVFICELGGQILGTTPPRRVSQQPYLGSFFKSQNASTWTPIQNQDLMFRIRKAVFAINSSGTVLLKPSNQFANVNIDSVIIHTVEQNQKPTSTKYKFRSNNVSGVQDAQYTYIPSNSLHRFGSDLLTSTKSSDRRRVIVAGDSASMNVGVELTSTDSDISPIVSLERFSMVAFENYINDASIANTDIAITSGGSHSNAANITVTISAPDLVDGTQATAYVPSLSGGKVTSVIVTNGGSGYITTPTITFSEPSAASNATAVVAGETSESGGNCKARYVTKQITLEDGFDSGDLRVYIDGNRPRGTNIHVYYKVKSAADSQNFADKKWKLMQKVSDVYSKDQSQIIELEYRPSTDKNVLSYVENGVTYPLGGKFKQYAIKIVMTAADTTVFPTVRNFRAIATPAG